MKSVKWRFFFLALILGGTLGWVGASRAVGGRRPTVLSLIFLAALVPGANLVIATAMASQRLVAAASTVLAIIVLTAGTWFLDDSPMMRRHPVNRRMASMARHRRLR